MSDKIVDLFAKRQKADTTSEEEEGLSLEDVISKNEANKKRVERERQIANKKLKRTMKLGKK